MPISHKKSAMQQKNLPLSSRQNLPAWPASLQILLPVAVHTGAQPWIGMLHGLVHCSPAELGAPVLAALSAWRYELLQTHHFFGYSAGNVFLNELKKLMN